MSYTPKSWDETIRELRQRCHLLYDIDEHVANAAATRRQKKIDAGQTELFEVTTLPALQDEPDMATPDGFNADSWERKLRGVSDAR